MDRFFDADPDNTRSFPEDAARMRRLAAQYPVRGCVRLRFGRRALRRLTAGLEEVRRLRAACRVPDAALARLDSQRPVIAACGRRAAAEGGARLPAWVGRPRIGVAMESLLSGGGTLTKERLLSALVELDAAQPLTQAELWAAPEALRAALSHALSAAAAAVARRGRLCVRAEGWVRRPGRRMPATDAAFFAHALKVAGEEELPRARRRLEADMARQGLAPEAVVARAQSEAAALLLRLDNLLAARRMLDGLNWQACFRAVSQVERALERDPAGIYPRMDAPSREAVRREVERMAKAAGLPEASVARAAVEAAGTGEGIRHGVCGWLYDDAGRRALLKRLGRGRAQLRRLTPDPGGRRTVALLTVLAALATLGIALCAGTPWLWAACVPLGWTAAGALAGRFYAGWFPPAHILKLDLDAVPEDRRTLVTLPALLSSPERAQEVCDRLETLGCLEGDPNIEYLLLGDFADAGTREQPGDEAILDSARGRIAAMNERAGREKYALLARKRTFLRADGIWMGRDRKRGALMDLNRLLLGAAGAEDAFSAEGAACGRLRGRFALVVTLDADTRALPEDIRRMIGAMAHPLNRPDGDRGFAVLQPRMETLPSGCANRFARLFAGGGGVSAYPVQVSNLWQDLTGRGIYAGKGIYDVAAFQSRLEGALPEGRVLSHDLIEGAVAGAGFLGDVALYDGHPATLSAALSRRHRWTRGDWQLLPLMFSRKKLPGGGRLGLADRFRMLDNLMRSLRAPALLALLIAGAWREGLALPAALLLCGLEAVLRVGDGDAMKWRRAVAEMATLPVQAWNALDAILRTLWRLGVSGRKLLEWVTAADAEARKAGDRAGRWPGCAAALLLLPGLFASDLSLAALALGALFLLGPAWIGDMQSEGPGVRETLPARDREAFEALARRTWRFFADNVPYARCPLPPDNVQLDPPVGAARRTSPTNIALYLLACLSARRLGFIGLPEMRGRVAGALDALERMEKWRGQLYNWYDIDTLAPLRPRYVSSVDSGNLAAALLLCAAAAETGPALSARLRALAQGMDLAALYDGERELFAIGLDGETGRLSDARYDLLASESRILSFTAMMLGQVSPRHWRRLGRACARVGDGVAPLSWSGTMFEYLMPELLMPAPEGTLLGEGVRAAVRAQMDRGRRLGRPWGVSESGFAALDPALNYQYRAFGLPELALDGAANDGVAAPYASMLAAMIVPGAAAQNLRRMAALGWTGEWGLYEAADYLRPGADGGPALVRSHMAHHQGMILCALCNVLTGGSLQRDLMGLPEARALSPLLEEPAGRAGGRRAGGVSRVRPEPAASRQLRRPGGDAPWPETHLLFGGGSAALCTADGATHYRRGDVMATRFSGRLQDRRDPARVWLTDLSAGAQAALVDRAAFEPGAARFAARLKGLAAEMTVCLSPEDGTLLKLVEVRNAGERPVRCAVTDIAPVALAREADWQAHAVFQSLFVESRRPAPEALLFERRPGSRGAVGMRLLHMAVTEGAISVETDHGLLSGRMDDAGRATTFDKPLSGGIGATLDPVSALRAELALAPGQRERVCFAMALLEENASVEDWLDRWRRWDRAERAARLASARAGAMLDFLDLGPAAHNALQRMAALLADGTLAAQARGTRRGEPAVRREALWPLGLSGDRPILALFAARTEDRALARALIRAHGFYRAMGVETDLALVDDGAAGYARPVRDMLEDLVAASHLNRLRGVAGGVWLTEGGRMDDDSRRALVRFASAVFVSGQDFYTQLRALLAIPSGLRRSRLRAMDAGGPAFSREARLLDNGYGGFIDGGYAIDVGPDRLPPAPWCNILANAAGGMLLSERGGGFFWQGNSRTGRLTPYGNDARREGWGLMLYLVDARRGEYLRLLPGARPQAAFRAFHDARSTVYTLEARSLSVRVGFAMAPEAPEANIDVAVENRGAAREELQLVAYVDWLMGGEPRDAVALNCWGEEGGCIATGAMPGAGWFAASDPLAQCGPGRCAFLGRGDAMAPEGFDAAFGEGWTLAVPFSPGRGRRRALRFALGWAADAAAARTRMREWRSHPKEAPVPPPPGLVIETPDAGLNALANGFLRHQALASRVLGRTGLCQPGGAWGFRDQLQDMLALLHDDPARVRAHLLRCAARQFEDGDVLHWWHAPRRGVRTRVSDDLLFLPFVAAAYVQYTGDAAVLAERAPYLKNAEIPEGQSDLYRDMEESDASDTLHGHCMRAFRRASKRGAHGLLLMGTGDWNDGMDRVGAAGRGESVWLSQFAIACADRYRRVAPAEADRVWLWRLGEELRRAVERHGWDGGWYLRAYDDAGVPLGSARNGECRIDAISQAWAVLAGLDGARCRRAMDAAWAQLADPAHGIIRLLTPPFEGRERDPGYLRGYPAGVRENGGQYTHGALWLLLALIRMGDEGRAHEALNLLLPFNHADTPEKAAVYRVEPYVMAADIYDRPGMRGRGGWTWYTGSAGWMYNCILELLGYERRGDRVRLRALLGEWPAAGVTVPFGKSRYRLVCDRETTRVTLDGRAVEGDFIQMADDGGTHEARFPAYDAHSAAAFAHNTDEVIR